MSVSSVFVKTPVHNGLSTMPIEFRVVQEHLRAEARDKQVSDERCFSACCNISRRNYLRAALFRKHSRIQTTTGRLQTGPAVEKYFVKNLRLNIFMKISS